MDKKEDHYLWLREAYEDIKYKHGQLKHNAQMIYNLNDVLIRENEKLKEMVKEFEGKEIKNYWNEK